MRITPADECKFYELFGRCINVWSFIDQHFFAFFAFALGTVEKPAAIIYYGYPNFGIRKDMTQKLMTVLLAEEAFKAHKPAWSAIMKEVDRLLPLRNLLAHEPTRQRIRVKIKLSRKEAHAVKLFQVHTDPRKVLAGKQPTTIEIEDLEAHLSDAKVVRAGLEKLANDVNETLIVLDPLSLKGAFQLIA